MIKLPKAAIETTAFSRDSSTQSYYTEAQLKQAVCDALKRAAELARTKMSGLGAEAAIRAIIKEI